MIKKKNPKDNGKIPEEKRKKKRRKIPKRNKKNFGKYWKEENVLKIHK